MDWREELKTESGVEKRECWGQMVFWEVTPELGQRDGSGEESRRDQQAKAWRLARLGKGKGRRRRVRFLGMARTRGHWPEVSRGFIRGGT